jgi:predicted oxidoreductase
MEGYAMERIALSDRLELSRIIYGMWRLTDDSDTSARQVQAKIEACLEQGITSFDQADIYGGYSSEAVLGEALKQAPSLREQMEIITKCDIVAPVGVHADKRLKYYDTSEKYITQSVERSLNEMAIEQIDLLLIHRPDPLLDADETGGALDRLVGSGKVKAVGVSNFRPWDIDLLQSRMKNKIVTNQIEISLTENSALTNGDLAYLQQHRIVPMAWSPLAGGSLFGGSALGLKLDEMAERFSVDPAALAIAWLLKHPANILPIMGSNNIQRIEGFSQALEVELNRQSWFELFEAANGGEVA